MTLLPCPYCGNPAQHYTNSDNRSNAIYCDVCPLGVEHSGMSDKELETIWNRLPRRNDPQETLP